MDKMIRQLVALSSKVAVLEAERPRATRVETQNPAPEVRGLKHQHLQVSTVLVMEIQSKTLVVPWTLISN